MDKILSYDDFKKDCFNELTNLQKRLEDDFGLSQYASWFYEQHTALLTLSVEGREDNFEYVSVGTFSRKSNTWMWSWNNNTLKRVSSPTKQIKTFGEAHQFERLTTGYFEGDEYTGWEFTAIAVKLLDGIGGYRVVSDELEIYMVIMDYVENEKAAEIKAYTIACDTHGNQRHAFVCQHLDAVAPKGFEEAFETEEGMELHEDDDLQAWCNLCEAQRLKTDGWNDESMAFAKIKVVCERCYFAMKKVNLQQK